MIRLQPPKAMLLSCKNKRYAMKFANCITWKKNVDKTNIKHEKEISKAFYKFIARGRKQ